jgi:enoyl-CoA hydratase
VNAINSRMHGELEQAAHELDSDRSVRAVVVYGGPAAFAGGADVKEMADLGPADIAVFGKSMTRALDAIAHLRVPTVAAVTGYALGGGFELALATDFRIVAVDALLGFPEITLGVIPGAGGTQRLPRLVGTAIAKRMIFLGKPIRGEKAVELGIAEEARPADEVFDTAMALARRLAEGATVALATAKRCIDDGLEVDLSTGLRIESAGFAALFATEDQKHGMASFLTDGPGKASFTGR